MKIKEWDGVVREYSHYVKIGLGEWRNYQGMVNSINKVVPPLNFKNCIWEIKK